MPHFMAGGADAYAKSLRQQYKAARERLKARRNESSDPVEQQAVDRELENLKKAYETKLRQIRGSLFGAS